MRAAKLGSVIAVRMDLFAAQSDVTRARSDGVRAGIEAACKAICEDCAIGNPIVKVERPSERNGQEGYMFHRWEWCEAEGAPPVQDLVDCKAKFIRALDPALIVAVLENP